MTHLVVDTSAIMAWFLPDERDGKYGFLLHHVDKTKIHVPSIFPYEFMNVLLSARRRNRIDQLKAIEAIETVYQYPIVVEPATNEIVDNIKIFEMAQMHRLTVYDAAYLALAIRLGLPLITNDGHLLNVAKSLGVKTTLSL